MSYHSYPTLSSLAQDHWTHRIQAPLTLQSSHNYTQPPYLHKLISTQRPLSSSAVTLARPPSSSFLKITDRSFRYASPCLWNQLPLSLCKLHSGTSSSISCSPIPLLPFDLPLCTSVTPTLFYSRLKTYLFQKSYPLNFTSSSRTASTDFCLHRFFWAIRYSVFDLDFFIIFCFRAVRWIKLAISSAFERT